LSYIGRGLPGLHSKTLAQKRKEGKKKGRKEGRKERRKGGREGERERGREKMDIKIILSGNEGVPARHDHKKCPQT
jgi:hypothetical protein